MNLIDKAFTLKKNPLFRELGLDTLLAIADKLKKREVKSDEVIFHFKQNAHQMYFIVSGSIELRDGEGKVAALLHEGDYFGDESLFNDQPRHYSAISQKNGLLLSLSRTHLLTIIGKSPSVAIRLLEAYSAALPGRSFH